MLQAVVLAGGLGMRLRPLTERAPKAMVPVGGRPFLDYLLAALRRGGVRDVLLLTGYLGARIRDHVGDGSRFGLRIRCSQEPLPLGTGGALRSAWSLLEAEFFLLNGDTYLPVDYQAVATRFRAAGVPLLMVVLENDPPVVGVPNNVGLDAFGFVRTYAKGTSDPRLRHVDAGLSCLRRDIVGRIPDRVPVSLELEVYPTLAAEGGISGYPVSARFYDIGTPTGLAELEELLRHDHLAHAVPD